MSHELVDQTFHETESDEYLSVVMFYAEEMCPCVRMKRQMEMARDYFTREGFRVRFYVVNVDLGCNEELVEKFDIDNTPKTVYIYGGRHLATIDGYQNKFRIINAVYATLMLIKDKTGVVL